MNPLRHQHKGPKPSLISLSESGYWFCKVCERITEPDEHDYLGLRCCHCNSPAIKFCEPVFIDLQTPAARLAPFNN